MEWGNIKTIILQAPDEILGKYDAFIQNKNFKRRGHEIKFTTEIFSIPEVTSNKDHIDN